MNDDESFAASFRSNDNVFGALGAADDVLDEIDPPSESPFLQAPNFLSPAQPSTYGRGFGEDAPAVSVAPAPATDTSNRFGAAITLFVLVGGAALGWHFGKGKGAIGGALAAAGVRNLYRAQKGIRSSDVTARANAVRPGLVGLVGLGAGGYLLYTATK